MGGHARFAMIEFLYVAAALLLLLTSAANKSAGGNAGAVEQD